MEPQIPPAPVSPALVVVAVLGALQTILLGLVPYDVVPDVVLGIAGLVVGVTLVTFTRVVYGTVTPWSTVAAKQTPDGSIVAGPAAPPTAAFPGADAQLEAPAVGAPVNVTPE